MSKYNSKKVTIDGITFDSKAEGNYYLHLKELKTFGTIKDFQCQPEYVLQPKYEKNGKNVLPIKYKADFLIYYHNGNTEVIDIKGMETTDFKLKKKIFEYKFPEEIVLICEAPKYLAPQEWIELGELKELRKLRKKVTDKYGKKKSPEKEAELQKITDKYKQKKGEK
ncbi:hypothetical protein BpsS36_00041 [Bacillus phage vB_BpsS-36]|uniref:DUF1064 domain-containing protein n=1 Tax=Bacillus phage vB_BpsS-36 TaxID=2419622 RepID=A0A3G3BX50_9CAUD|nr:hypothetical protein BpsS36_00041 [Bacillus phage vB_BpsS-36]